MAAQCARQGEHWSTLHVRSTSGVCRGDDEWDRVLSGECVCVGGWLISKNNPNTICVSQPNCAHNGGTCACACFIKLRLSDSWVFSSPPRFGWAPACASTARTRGGVRSCTTHLTCTSRNCSSTATSRVEERTRTAVHLFCVQRLDRLYRRNASNTHTRV